MTARKFEAPPHEQAGFDGIGFDLVEGLCLTFNLYQAVRHVGEQG